MNGYYVTKVSMKSLFKKKYETWCVKIINKWGKALDWTYASSKPLVLLKG